MKEWHPGVKRMALEVPDAGLILNAAGVHAALLRYYGQLTQRLYMSLDYYNASILCVCARLCVHVCDNQLCYYYRNKSIGWCLYARGAVWFPLIVCDLVCYKMC